MVDSFSALEAGVQLNFSEDTGQGGRFRKRVWNGGRGRRQLLPVVGVWGVCDVLGLEREAELRSGVL